jgi:hypothetical protein
LAKSHHLGFASIHTGVQDHCRTAPGAAPIEQPMNIEAAALLARPAFATEDIASKLQETGKKAPVTS